MCGKLWLTLFHCVIGPVLILGRPWSTVKIAGGDPVAGLALTIIVLVLPVLIITRVSWAAGYAAGRRERESNPPADG